MIDNKQTHTEMTNFEKVSKWVKDNYDIDVQLSDMTLFMGHSQKKIFIHHNYNLEKNGLIALLHEVGHVTQPSEKSDKFGPNRYKRAEFMDNEKMFNMLRFMNEVDAWDRGEKIAEDLGIELDQKRWTKNKEEALETYYVMDEV